MTGALVQKRDDLAVDLIDLLTMLLNLGKIAAVSYTHLDVYKRQLVGHVQLLDGRVRQVVHLRDVEHEEQRDGRRHEAHDNRCLLYTSRCV